MGLGLEHVSDDTAAAIRGGHPGVVVSPAGEATRPNSAYVLRELKRWSEAARQPRDPGGDHGMTISTPASQATGCRMSGGARVLRLVNERPPRSRTANKP